jgi:short-subunit dehydrogenase
MRGEVALVTGGSRGLGLLLAKELGLAGCRVAVCARGAEQLREAKAWLKRAEVEAETFVCDVSQRGAVDALVEAVEARLGAVDVLVNNAGTIQVAPIENSTLEDFEAAQGAMFWGPLHTTMAVLPGMLRKGKGRIVNVTSLGGLVSVPHLIPYGAAKAGAVALSEGLHAELASKGIRVTTVAPGTMRTGGHVNARFRGRSGDEYRWFALAASLPGISVSAERAARRIVRAAIRGEAFVVIGAAAKAAAVAHGVAPGAMSDALGVVSRLLPPAGGGAAHTGAEIGAASSSRWLAALTKLGRNAEGRLQHRPQPTI